jgi:small subunit ribosomal protein S6
MMRDYETLMVLHPDLPEAQTRETVDRARRLLEEGGAQIRQIQEWGMRDLAYPIRKQQRGYYVLFEYVSSADAVKELERNLKIADEMLRFISVASPKIPNREPEASSKMLRTGDGSTDEEINTEPATAIE